jgi:hypothetical protein
VINDMNADRFEYLTGMQVQVWHESQTTITEK